jgi:hypothetical protein
MKNLILIKVSLWKLALILFFTNLQIVSGQVDKDQTSLIPENINKIFQASCMKCHATNGKIMAKTKLNFSKWAEYDSETKAKKASEVCSELNKESMPPKSARKSNPELVPTKEQTELICKWAELLKSKVETK